MARKHSTAAACIALLAAPGVAQAATLATGDYLVYSYYQSTSATGGGTCLFPTGTTLSSVFYYPGAAKPGATAHTLINAATAQYVLVVKFPTTPASGVTHSSGKVTESFQPGGASITGTLSSNITVIDATSYTATTTYVFPGDGGGTCTSVVNDVAALSSK